MASVFGFAFKIASDLDVCTEIDEARPVGGSIHYWHIAQLPAGPALFVAALPLLILLGWYFLDSK